MSRGPGRIERHIEFWFTFLGADQTYVMDELVYTAYDHVWETEKKHRVATMRAAKKVCKRTWWSYRYSTCMHGNPAIFYNLRNARSRTIAQIRSYRAGTHEWAAAYVDNMISVNQDQKIQTVEYHEHLKNVRDTEILLASIEGDDYRHDLLMLEDAPFRADRQARQREVQEVMQRLMAAAAG